MKRFNLTKIVSLMLACMMLVGMMTIPTVAAESADGEVAIVSTNVEFGETIRLIFAVKTPATGNTKVTVADEQGNPLGECEKYYKDGQWVTIGENTYAYVMPFGVPAHDIAKQVKVTVTYTAVGGEKTTATADYSVLEYLYTRKYVSINLPDNNKNKPTDADIAMYDALIAYAKAAEVALGITSANPIDAYGYVNCVDCLVNGEKAGIFKLGDTVTITPTVEAGENQRIDYTVNGQPADVEGGITVTDKVIVKAEVVDNSQPEPDDDGHDGTLTTATITFDNTSKRIALSTEEQVWTENGIVFTNNKAESTSAVADYVNPVRCYKSSTITIAYPGMTEIVFNCNSGYADEIQNSIEGSVLDGNTVTVTFDSAKDSFEFTLAAAARIDSITVSSIHVWNETPTTSTNATCDVEGEKTYDCTVCDATRVEIIPATGHTEETVAGHAATCQQTGLTDGKVCSVCHTTLDKQTELPVVACHDGDDADTLCDWCNADLGGSTAPTEKVLATFTMGTDNTSKSNSENSTAKTEYTETQGSYTLKLTSADKMYPTSYDKVGNAIIKLGSSKAAGKFTFTVPNNVTSVKIYVAGRQTKTGGCKINGVTYTITTLSDNDVYTEIVIDTTTTKTIKFETSQPDGGDIRLYLNTIEFIGYAQ